MSRRAQSLALAWTRLGPRLLPFADAATQELPLGSRAQGPDGSEWIYVKAGATINQYDACRLTGTSLGYDDVRPTSAAQQYVAGVADAAFASGEFGFIQSKGRAICKVVNSTAAASLLTTSGTAGTLALSTQAADLSGTTPAVALVTGVSTGSAIVIG